MSASPKRSPALGIHFIGIGGIGMSGLARYFHGISKSLPAKGIKWAVSGSDATKGILTEELRKEGINVKIGHKKGNIPPNTRLIVYNRAIREDNPELVAARAKKDAVTLPYSKVLGRLTEQYRTIAITGSHGKSTTTALAGLALLKGDVDPTILVGTKMKDLGGKNIRFGNSSYLLLEADDYGAAFLDYSPLVSIVTNIDREHMDFYKTEANVKRSFLKFLERTRQNGVLILNRDDKPLFSLKKRIARLAKKKNLRVIWYSTKSDAMLASRIAKTIAIPGAHNVSNALAVAKLGEILDIPERTILAALHSYKGAWRRMELRGALRTVAGKAAIYDDYAHHPAEIRATLAAFREKFRHSPLVCVFQPHQAKRLNILFDEFTRAFDVADAVFLLPLYKVLGRDEKEPKDSESLARAIAGRSPARAVFYLDDPQQIRSAVLAAIRDVPVLRDRRFTRPPVIIMMGAGDIVDLTKILIK